MFAIKMVKTIDHGHLGKKSVIEQKIKSETGAVTNGQNNKKTVG